MGLINELGLTPLPLVQTMSAFLTVFFLYESFPYLWYDTEKQTDVEKLGGGSEVRGEGLALLRPPNHPPYHHSWG